MGTPSYGKRINDIQKIRGGNISKEDEE